MHRPVAGCCLTTGPPQACRQACAQVIHKPVAGRWLSPKLTTGCPQACDRPGHRPCTGPPRGVGPLPSSAQAVHRPVTSM
eukprot:8425472-Pyramimonas_sp.AAC.1